jgi:hypothetical protein
MIIRLISGEEIRAAFQEVETESLLVSVDGNPRALPKREVAKITTAGRRAGALWKGALVGAGIGAAIGVAVRKDPDNELGARVAPIALAGWAGIGPCVQAAAQRRIVLYRAPGVD